MRRLPYKVTRVGRPCLDARSKVNGSEAIEQLPFSEGLRQGSW